MRKTVIIILSIVFTGGLMAYTVQANLDLLTLVSPNPKFIGFAMLALEGGVVYWLAYYLIHWNGSHKGIAICMVGFDFLLSMVGFFADTNLTAAQHAAGVPLASWFPSIVMLVTADVAINVLSGIIVHLLPDNKTITKEDFVPLLEAGNKVRDTVSPALESASKMAKTTGDNVGNALKNGYSHLKKN